MPTELLLKSLALIKLKKYISELILYVLSKNTYLCAQINNPIFSNWFLVTVM